MFGGLKAEFDPEGEIEASAAHDLRHVEKSRRI
jgi:hypothetical protein